MVLVTAAPLEAVRADGKGKRVGIRVQCVGWP